NYTGTNSGCTNPIPFAFKFDGANVTIISGGLPKQTFPFAQGDFFKLERQNNTFKYWYNNTLKYTETFITQDIYVDGYCFVGDGWTDVFSDCRWLSENPCSLSVLTGTNLSYCPGESLQLIASGAAFYTWSPNTWLSCDNCPNPVLYNPGGDVASQYTVVAYGQVDVLCGTATITIDNSCNSAPVIGCCFNNFGAGVYVVEGTYVNVYCNLINEVTASSSGLDKGLFQNEKGNVRVLREWINNGFNELYSVYKGNTELFGGYQRIRGNAPTHFNLLKTGGAGKKELKIDAFAHEQLDLTQNELSVSNWTFFVEKNTPAAVIRSTGFVSTDGTGYLARKTDGVGSFLFPLGSTVGLFRYRPLELKSIGSAHQFKAGLLNQNATTNGLIAKAADVQSVNPYFYHRIQSGTSPIAASIKSYYLETSDGTYQSVAHWATTPAWWESPVFGQYFAANADGLSAAEINGTLSFQGEPFILARAGFYVDLDDFGDPGTTVTVTQTSGGSGNQTGGLGQGQNTGSTTVFAPNNTPGSYQIGINSPGTSTVPGNVNFNIGSNGTVSDVTYTSSSGGSGNLSPDLYSIDNTSTGITLNDTPPPPFDCTSSISVKMGVNVPMVLTALEKMIIDGLPAGTQTLTLKIIDKTGAVVNTQSFTAPVSPLQINVNQSIGPYRFELTLTNSTSGVAVLHGYFLIQ
ncbi:MAG: hypothetical protein ABIQ93_04815, partial [Saprospiraceae bacterium]